MLERSATAVSSFPSERVVSQTGDRKIDDRLGDVHLNILGADMNNQIRRRDMTNIVGGALLKDDLWKRAADQARRDTARANSNKQSLARSLRVGVKAQGQACEDDNEMSSHGAAVKPAW